MGKIIVTYWKNLFLEALKTMWEKLGFWGLLFGLVFSGIYALITGSQTVDLEGILIFTKVFFVFTLTTWLYFVFMVSATQDKGKQEKIKFLDEELNSIKPNIQIKGELDVHETPITHEEILKSKVIKVPHAIAVFANVPFANTPQHPTSQNNALNVRAEITYFDENKTILLSNIQGRWGDTPEPFELNSREIHTIESIDFPNNGAIRWLSLIIKYPEDKYCYAYNNNSYRTDNNLLLLSEYQITKKRFFIHVRLRGAYISDNEWEFEVVTKGEGDAFQIRYGKTQFPKEKLRGKATKALTKAKKTIRKKSSPRKSS